MTNSTNRVEIITSVQRRRRWTAPEKVRMVEETFEPGMTVSLVARRHGVAPNQLFTWRRLVAQGRLSKVHRATEWLKPSFARSSATMSASVRDQMPKPSCVSCQLGSPTTTRFTRTRLSDIVHPVSSSQLTQDPDRVRSFGGYNSYPPQCMREDKQEDKECSGWLLLLALP